MPVKAEKEPMRHLCKIHNSLKSQTTLVEQEGWQMVSPVSIQQPAAAVLPQRTVLPVSSGPDGGEDSPVGAGEATQNSPRRRHSAKSCHRQVHHRNEIFLLKRQKKQAALDASFLREGVLQGTQAS
jgi:hypothetical protein